MPEELWSLIAAHLPAHRRSPRCGRPRISDGAALTGIVFVLTTGIHWEYIPRELGCDSGMTYWRSHSRMDASKRLVAYPSGSVASPSRARPNHVAPRQRRRCRRAITCWRRAYRPEPN
ncbi:transposase [Massilia sp. S19_KUP03_FR1]|uniref:transposase n=1 Tax=Massilia sp. S19_KUP03_FR1 TaxID=3025503 RepID=UPI003FA522DA